MVNGDSTLAEGQGEVEVLREYYRDHDALLSLDGLLKVFAVMSCVACAALKLVGGASAGGGTGAWGGACGVGGAGTPLAAALLLSALYAAAVCSLPVRAPQAWLYTDLVVSTTVGGALLVSALLLFTLCDAHTPLDYVHGSFALLSSGLVIMSAVMSYTSVARRWDEADPAYNPTTPQPAPTELEV